MIIRIKNLEIIIFFYVVCVPVCGYPTALFELVFISVRSFPSFLPSFFLSHATKSNSRCQRPGIFFCVTVVVMHRHFFCVTVVVMHRHFLCVTVVVMHRHFQKLKYYSTLLNVMIPRFSKGDPIAKNESPQIKSPPPPKKKVLLLLRVFLFFVETL